MHKRISAVLSVRCAHAKRAGAPTWSPRTSERSIDEPAACTGDRERGSVSAMVARTDLCEGLSYEGEHRRVGTELDVIYSRAKRAGTHLKRLRVQAVDWRACSVQTSGTTRQQGSKAGTEVLDWWEWPGRTQVPHIEAGPRPIPCI